ncbi:MAG: signal recognition particle-docking protein FtsY [Desulfovibrio sp.]|nr:signal recognition particle-docking protein FtsY [Desulfovibrio sp.]
MGFFTKLKKIFSGKEGESVSSEEEKKEAEVQEGEVRSSSQDEEAESSGQEKNEALVQQSAGREGESSSGKSDEPSCHGGSADRDERGEGYAAHGMPEEAAPSAQQISESGVPSGKEAPSAAAEPEKAAEQPVQSAGAAAPSPASAEEEELTVRLRACEPRLSVWLDTVLDGVTEAGPLLEKRIRFLLSSLEAPAAEIDSFVSDFSGWLERMEYRNLDEFRSELQYRLALALDLEDEEDERSRLFIKLSDGLAKTREQFSRRLEGLFASNGELNDEFWEQMEEIFIMADLGYEASEELVSRLRERCRQEKVTSSQGVREVLRQEIKSIFAQPRRISAVNPPEIVLMIGVNGAGKTTTIAKLAYRDRMQGKKVMIAAADTFRAAAIDQLRVWSERVGTLFHAKQPGADPASVAYEAVDRAIKEGVDVLYVDTAGRLQTKVNLMDELTKIRQVIGKKHPGAPHRTVLVLDATTGQNALSQAKLFKESAGVDELILTKLDGTAKGGVAIAVAMQYKLPITFIGLGEKVEDLRPFNGDDYADALLASV